MSSYNSATFAVLRLRRGLPRIAAIAARRAFITLLKSQQNSTSLGRAEKCGLRPLRELLLNRH